MPIGRPVNAAIISPSIILDRLVKTDIQKNLFMHKLINAFTTLAGRNPSKLSDPRI